MIQARKLAQEEAKRLQAKAASQAGKPLKEVFKDEPKQVKKKKKDTDDSEDMEESDDSENTDEKPRRNTVVKAPPPKPAPAPAPQKRGWFNWFRPGGR